VKNAQAILAVSAAVVKDGKFLLVRRGREPARGLFAFPGGRVEIGETPEEAVRRELMEETAVEAGPLEFFRELEITDPADESRILFRLRVFHGAYASGTETAGDDAEAVGWFTTEAMHELPMTATTLAIAEEIWAATASR
jgi:mutator protein MutT